jgi:hypothetical protein
MHGMQNSSNPTVSIGLLAHAKCHVQLDLSSGESGETGFEGAVAVSMTLLAR